MIYYLTKDLMMASNVQAVARRSQKDLKIVPSVAKLLELAESKAASRVLVDLQTPGLGVEAVLTLVDQLTAIQNAPAPVIGYAQHVHVDLMRAASDSGFTSVVTRGQMHHNAAEFLE
jgi:membrane-bound ClpP family serine protease